MEELFIDIFGPEKEAENEHYSWYDPKNDGLFSHWLESHIDTMIKQNRKKIIEVSDNINRGTGQKGRRANKRGR